MVEANAAGVVAASSGINYQCAKRSAKPWLIGGVFLARPELEDCWDLTIWLDVPFEVTVERAIARDQRNDGDAAVTRGKYECRYGPGQRLYLTECRPRDRARIVVDNSVHDRPTIVVHRT